MRYMKGLLNASKGVRSEGFGVNVIQSMSRLQTSNFSKGGTMIQSHIDSI